VIRTSTARRTRCARTNEAPAATHTRVRPAPGPPWCATTTPQPSASALWPAAMETTQLLQCGRGRAAPPQHTDIITLGTTKGHLSSLCGIDGKLQYSLAYLLVATICSPICRSLASTLGISHAPSSMSCMALFCG
jgi:hypothetical protein